MIETILIHSVRCETHEEKKSEETETTDADENKGDCGRTQMWNASPGYAKL